MRITSMAGRRGWVMAAVLTLALVVGSVAGSLVTAKSQWLPLGPENTVPMYIAQGGTNAGNPAPLPMSYASVIKPATRAVVNIASSKIVRNPEGNSRVPFLNDPFFRRFFGDDFRHQFSVSREQREQSLGSGVIVSPERYILTNDHVVDGATDVKVFLTDKRQLNARIVGTGPKTDIAVLKVDGRDLSAITLGNSSNAQVGDIAFAIGNPFGIGQTVTMGIVSATGRGNLGIEDYAGLRRGDVIQEVNRKPITSVTKFERAVAQTGNQPMLLLVNRGGNTLYIAIESR